MDKGTNVPADTFCRPFDNSGHFECKAGIDGNAAFAVIAWTHPTSKKSGEFCLRHSPFTN